MDLYTTGGTATMYALSPELRAYYELQRKHTIETLNALDDLLGRERTIERRQRPR